MPSLDNVESLPSGTPLLVLVGRGVNLRMVVIRDNERKEFLVGLVVTPWLIEPLGYYATFLDGLDALGAITRAFTAMGFTIEDGEIGDRNG